MTHSYDNNKPISYYDVTGTGIKDVFHMLPEQYRQFFRARCMIVTKPIAPHTDSNIKVGLNVYVQPGNYVTSFYKKKDININVKQVLNQTNGVVYNKHDLILTDSFIAKPKEAWLLDVTQPHSVDPFDQRIDERIAIAIHTMKFSYNEVKQMLYDTGSIDYN